MEVIKSSKQSVVDVSCLSFHRALFEIVRRLCDNYINKDLVPLNSTKWGYLKFDLSNFIVLFNMSKHIERERLSRIFVKIT